LPNIEVVLRNDARLVRYLVFFQELNQQAECEQQHYKQAKQQAARRARFVLVPKSVEQHQQKDAEQRL
nr:hypothetical protein [Tanacetum cinerariifolium]